MSRYQQLSTGVYDTQAKRQVLPRTPEWKHYQQWLAAGNAPAPAPRPDPQEALTRRRLAHRQRVFAASAAVASAPFAAAGTTFKLDAAEQALLIAALAVGAPLPAGFGWRDTAGTFVALNMQALKTLVGEIVRREFARRARQWALLAAIDASPNPDQKNIGEQPNPTYVDVNNGWPS